MESRVSEINKEEHPTPIVSVIIPVYNAENYIDRCIESVVEQSIKNIEILLMIGMCKDSSLSRGIDWQKKDERIVIVSRKDRGLGDARNYALGIARGKYLAYIDSDDYVTPFFLEKMITPLEKDESIILSCSGFNKVDNCENIVNTWLPQLNGFVESDFQKYISLVSYGTVWLKVYRREWIMENGITMYNSCHEDDALHMCLAGMVSNLYFVQEPLYQYNIGNDNSLMHDIPKRLDYFNAMEFAFSYLKSKDKFYCNIRTIRKIIISSLKFMLKEYSQYSIFAECCQEFIMKNFPEIMYELDKFKKSKKIQGSDIVVWGAGRDCENTVYCIGKEQISYIIDSDKNKQGNKIDNLAVYSPEYYFNENIYRPIVISSSEYFYEIALQLTANNITEYFSLDEYLVKEKFENSTDKRFILINTPEHRNIGDHGIAEAIKIFLKNFHPCHEVIEITEHFYNRNRFLIREKVLPTDTIIVTGGGYLGILWMENGEKNVRNILTDYKNNKIIIFPQTMFYGKKIDELEINKAHMIYEKCKDLSIMLREEQSYELAKQYFGDTARCELIPDIVLSLTGFDVEVIREDSCAVCFKNNKEENITEQEKKIVFGMLAKNYSKTIEISMYAEHDIGITERWDTINEKINELKQYKLVVTDALHCMIFCAISGTPCISFDNISGKSSGIYKWIKDLSYIKFVYDMDDFRKEMMELKEISSTKYSFDYEPFMPRINSLISGND